MVIARPAKPAAVIADNVYIKPPITLRIVKPELPAIPSGLSAVDYTIYIDYCKTWDEKSKACQDVVPGLSILIHCYGSNYDVRLGVREYYTGSGLVLARIAKDLDLTAKSIIDLTLNGPMVSLAVDGRTYANTNMFKEALPITRISFEVVAYDQNGNAIDPPAEFKDPAWFIDVIQLMDVNAVIASILPIAAGALVVGLIGAAISKLAEQG